MPRGRRRPWDLTPGIDRKRARRRYAALGIHTVGCTLWDLLGDWPTLPRSRKPNRKPKTKTGAKARGSLAPTVAKAKQALNSGKLAEAEELYRKVLSQLPKQPDSLHGLGVIAQASGKSDIALDYLRKALAQVQPQVQPQVPPGFDMALLQSHLGVVYRALGDLETSVDHHRQALALSPQSPSIRNNLGNALKDMEVMEEALEHFEEAVRLAPKYPEANRNLGITLRDMGREEDAVPYLEAAVKLRPTYCEALNDLGALYRKWDRDQEAEVCFRNAIKGNPKFPASYANLAGTQQRLGNMTNVAALYRKALELEPDLPEALLGLASTLEHDGQVEEAVAMFRRALSFKGSLGNAYLSLASIPSITMTEAEQKKMDELLADDTIREEDRSSLLFAKAKLADRAKDYDQAFAFAKAANDLEYEDIDYSTEGNRRFTARCKELFTPAFFAARKDFGVTSERPIFVLGLPRSGTTLVEQIVSSHPDVYGAGELVNLHNLARGLPNPDGEKRPFPDSMVKLEAAAARDVAGRYLEVLDGHSKEAKHVTDKLPFNFRYLGLIALLFPNAKVIHCRRDPRDIAISCYFIKFLKPISFAYNLTDFGNYYRDYRELMAHWKEVLPIPVLDVDYEDVVANQEPRSRQLIEFCGLPWDDACLTYHEAERAVHTASSWQVRQPIYKTSVQKWRRYEAHLGPLVDAIGDALPAPAEVGASADPEAGERGQDGRAAAASLAPQGA